MDHGAGRGHPGTLRVTVTLTNPGEGLAFFVHPVLTRGPGGEEVLPTLWSDGYVSVLPGETRVLTAEVEAERLGGAAPWVRVEGWNVAPVAVPAGSGSPADPAETARTDRVMRLWIEEVWHGGRLELVPELVAPRYVRHEAEGTYTVTPEAYADRIRALRDQFPDLRYEIHDAAAVGDRFWIRYTFRGGPDSTGPWPKRPGLQLYRLEEGRLAETWMLLGPGDSEWTDPRP
jgi:hypothetical protein